MSFLPRASLDETVCSNELQRKAAAPHDAARIPSALGDVDVHDDASNVHLPALMAHPRDDLVVPMKDVVELAADIPSVRVVPLDTPIPILPRTRSGDAALSELLRETRF